MIANQEVQISRTTCSPDKVPQLQGADRQEYDTQEPRCGRGIGSGEKIGLFRQVYSVHFVKSFDKLDENRDVDLVIYTCIESKPSRSKSSHTVNPILLDKKYLSANTQCWISIYFNEIFIRHLPHRNNSASTLI